MGLCPYESNLQEVINVLVNFVVSIRRQWGELSSLLDSYNERPSSTVNGTAYIGAFYNRTWNGDHQL